MNLNGAINAHSQFNAAANATNQNWNSLIDEEMTNKTRERIVVAVIDAAVNNNEIESA